MNPIIFYARHGQTDWNAEHRFQGRREVPMNERGLEQARSHGRRLAASGIDLSGFRFISSPLGRARETMRLIRTELALPPDDFETDDVLLEASYGDFEGLTYAEMASAHPEFVEWRLRDRWNSLPPNGESLALVRERIRPFFETLEGDVFLVAHGALGRAVRQLLLGLPEEEAANFEFPQDCIFRFEAGEERRI